MPKSKRSLRNWQFNTIQTRIRTTPMAQRRSSRRLLTLMKYCQTKRNVEYITSRVKRACDSMNRCKDSQAEASSSITWTLTTSSPISSVAAEDRSAVEAVVVVVTTNSSTSTWVEEAEALDSNITSNSSKKLSQISLRTQMCTVLT